MERRIAHLTGIRRQQRQQLIQPLTAYFEIYDEADDDAVVEKRWRLWERPEQSGAVLLSSVFHFEGANDADEAGAIAAAQASIQQVIHYGLDTWNYHVLPAGATTFNFALRHPDAAVREPDDSVSLGLSNPPRASAAAAQAAIRETIEHLYTHYSAEGFHLVEHILLRPQRGPDTDPTAPEPYPGDALLARPSANPDTASEIDPYSYQVSLIFPSGYARDFSPAASNPEARSPVPPHRFRDRELRRHVERIVQQSCPAHLRPLIYWVDRHVSEQSLPFPEPIPETATDISFEQFEAIYFAWLNTQLLPGVAAEAAIAARNQMILAMNALSAAPPPL
ncbi:MAG: hypothetical protein F6K00_18775 [Leptolyngbya sp. SIOISBB]|nr:hypothetical protein [Leptolyngbya sp. SIOISBB]